jgi:hydrogenase-4 component E
VTTDAALTLAAGAVLVCAVMVLWMTSVHAAVRIVAVQGIALGSVALLLGVRQDDAGLIATAVVVVLVKGVVIPVLLGRAGGGGVLDRETRPLMNVPAGLVASAVLILVAFLATRGIGRFVGTRAGALVPVGVATLLVGFLVLVTRRRPVLQIVGLLMVDNGIALVAFLSTAGVPFLIELGVSLDVLLGVIVLMVLTRRLRSEFGNVDLDELQDLHD